MSMYFDSNGKEISIGKIIGKGGEGSVYKTNRNVHGKKQVAKIYSNKDLEGKPLPKQVITERNEKLVSLVTYPPKEPYTRINHVSFAWPQALVFDNQKRIVGYLMPKVSEPNTLRRICNTKLRKKHKYTTDWQDLHVAAFNIASIIQALHENSPFGYVLGDIKLENIMINSRSSLPTIVDIDSFQAYNPSNKKTYKCIVGSEDFTPPELIGEDFSTIQQHSYHDDFRLAVVIYYLLLGSHPFKGIWQGHGEAPEPNKIVKEGIWPYSSNKGHLMKAGPNDVPFDILHPRLKAAFLRCFNEGHQNPSRRPTAGEWKKELSTAIKDLKQCSRVSSHWHSHPKSSQCYWCERKALLKSDMFPRIIDLQRLEEYLKQRQWKQADLETKFLLRGSAHRILDEQSLDAMREDIKSINELWGMHSKGRFGFSAQKRILERTGNLSGEYEWQKYCQFGKSVGWWDESSQWKDYQALPFSTNSNVSPTELPKGHLPFVERGFSKLPLILHIVPRLS